ncbi:MAG: hypothetical protein KAW93_07245 [Methanogenium sp.]|nr:hypothetical protein [Methanogenium sp.]
MNCDPVVKHQTFGKKSSLLHYYRSTTIFNSRSTPVDRINRSATGGSGAVVRV